MRNLLKNDIFDRAWRTFVQTFLASVAVGVAGVVDWNSAKALLLSALAGAISVAWNSIISK